MLTEIFVVLIVVLFYIMLSSLFIKFVQRRTTNQTYRRLALAFVLLLPTWDVLLGFIVYYPACLILPKPAIYETAVTDGIYYEGMRDYLRQQKTQRRDGDEYKLVGTGWIASGMKKGFLFIEYKSERQPIIYECVKLEKDNPINENANAICRVRNSIRSRYEVRVITIPLGITDLQFKNIYDRNTGKLLAIFNRAVRWGYYGISYVPFFNWLDWGWWSTEELTSRCPASETEYESFEYKVLQAHQ